MPDISLIVCKDFIVFDKTQNKVFIVVFSDCSKKDYENSKSKVNEYKNLLMTDIDTNFVSKINHTTEVKYDFSRIRVFICS